jgi:hypothetical protein
MVFLGAAIPPAVPDGTQRRAALHNRCQISTLIMSDSILPAAEYDAIHFKASAPARTAAWCPCLGGAVAVVRVRSSSSPTIESAFQSAVDGSYSYLQVLGGPAPCVLASS